MTFGSQRLRRPEVQTNLIALYNDQGSDWTEVFELKGRQQQSVAVLDVLGVAAANVQYKPTFAHRSDLLASGTSDAGGADLKIYQLSGTNSWVELSHSLSSEPFSDPDYTSVPYSLSWSRSSIWGGGNLLAVTGTSDTIGPTLIYVSSTTDRNWDTPQDWDSFADDQWGFDDEWQGLDSWDLFPDDRWSTETSVFQQLGTSAGNQGYRDITFSAGDSWLAAVGYDGSNSTLQLWKPLFTGSAYTGYTPVSTPTTNRPTGIGRCITFSANLSYMVVGTSASPYIWIYQYDGSTQTFGKIANPSDLPDGTVTAVRFDPTDTYLAVGLENGSSNNDDCLMFYKRSGSTFTKLAAPATMPTDRVLDIAWSSDGNYVMVCQDATNSYLYRKSGDTFVNVKTFGDAVACAVYPPAANTR